MPALTRDINTLAEEFERCQQILLAFGDENRQHLILEMMRMGHCGGARVGAITEKTNLSRPAWFRRGVDAALLAPTAMNQQKFTFALEGGAVRAKAGAGFYTRTDLGIAKYHFEAAAGEENVQWA